MYYVSVYTYDHQITYKEFRDSALTDALPEYTPEVRAHMYAEDSLKNGFRFDHEDGTSTYYPANMIKRINVGPIKER